MYSVSTEKLWFLYASFILRSDRYVLFCFCFWFICAPLLWRWLWIIEFTFFFFFFLFVTLNSSTMFLLFSVLLYVICIKLEWKRTRVWISFQNEILGTLHSRKYYVAFGISKTVSGVMPARVSYSKIVSVCNFLSRRADHMATLQPTRRAHCEHNVFFFL